MTTVLEKKNMQSQGVKVKMTMAQALLTFLSKQKVEQFDGSFAPRLGGICGIYGHGNVAGIGEALFEKQEEIPYYRGQNEQGMAHAAIAYAKANRARRIMGVTTSIGPGATNLITASALAHTNRLPVLFLPGDIYASRRQDPVLQQLEDERYPCKSVNDCFEPVSRYYDRLTRPEQLIASLPQAIATLLDPVTRGPVTLALPQDVQAEAYEYPEWFFKEKIHYIKRFRPDERELQRVALKVRKSKRPLLIVGGGCHYSDAEEQLQEFVNKHAIAVTETQSGKGSLPWDHPMNLGGIGVTGTASANALAKEADLILAIGTRLSDFPTASKTLFHREGAEIIGINCSLFDASKESVETLVSDAKVGLQELSKALDDYRSDEEYLIKVAEEKREWEKSYIEITSSTDSLKKPTDAQILATVNSSIYEHDIVVSAAGGLPGELHKLWRAKDKRGYHVEYAYSCMGYEIAGGLGVKMAFPEREIYVMVGDGSYLMLHTELLTSIQLGYKINIILLDNRGFGCINRLQKQCGCSPYGNLFTQEGNPQVDFVANARSYGAYSLKVNTLTELKEAIITNRAKSVSTVTVVETDPEKGSPGTAWWDVAIPECSNQPRVVQARKEYIKSIQERVK